MLAPCRHDPEDSRLDAVAVRHLRQSTAMPGTDSADLNANQPTATVLVLSHDAVAAALLGALVETLGYPVRFRRPPEGAEEALRRLRPQVALIDCADPDACTDEIVGRAMMRGVSVVIFGTREALDRVRAFALEHDITRLLMPPEAKHLERVLRQTTTR